MIYNFMNFIVLFLNIQGLTKEEYLNREIKDIDLEEINEFSINLFKAIRDRNK